MQYFAQELLLVGKELDLHLEKVVLVVLGAGKLCNPAVQIGRGTDHRLELAGQGLGVAEQGRGQLKVDQVAVIDLEEAQAHHDRVARPLICHTAVRLEVVLQRGGIEVDMMI